MEYALDAEQIANKIVRELIYDGLLSEEAAEEAHIAIQGVLDYFNVGE